ncbi:hypothetical protein Tco_0836807 [Tanacetum coccineum]
MTCRRGILWPRHHACHCGSGDIVLRESYKPKTRCKLYYACPLSKPRQKHFSDVNFFYGKRNESVYWSVLLELQRLQFILQDLHRLQFILPGSQHPLRYSQVFNTSTAISTDLQEMQSTTSNCKHLLDKITVLEVLQAHNGNLPKKEKNKQLRHLTASDWIPPEARLTRLSFLLSGTQQMAGSVEGGGPKRTDDREETPPPLTKEQIEGHVFALKSLIKSHNRKNRGDPIRLDFEMVDTEVQDHNVVKGKEVMDEVLRKPFKEARITPFTRRIIEFAGP